MTSKYSHTSELAETMGEPVYAKINDFGPPKKAEERKEKKGSGYAALKLSQIQQAEYADTQGSHGHQLSGSPGSRNEGTPVRLPRVGAMPASCCKMAACFTVVLLIWVIASTILMAVVYNEIKDKDSGVCQKCHTWEKACSDLVSLHKMFENFRSTNSRPRNCTAKWDEIEQQIQNSSKICSAKRPPESYMV